MTAETTEQTTEQTTDTATTTKTLHKNAPKGRLDHTQIESKNFLPLPFQTILYESAKERNTIICLGTGTGKTFIAIMLLKEMSWQVRGDFILDEEGRECQESKHIKRTVFLVPTRPLVRQHARCIRDIHSDLSVGEFTGDTIGNDLEFWSEAFWTNALATINVAVMTAEIFNRILTHNCFPLSRVNLLIFDECHWAKKNHPYNEIMSHYDSCPEPPRILGLSASIITQKSSPEKVKRFINEISRNLRSKVDTWSDLKNINKYGTNPKEEMVYFDSKPPLDNKVLIDLMSDITSKINELLHFITLVSVNQREKSGVKFVVKALQHILSSLEDLGIWSAEKTSLLLSQELGERIAMERSSSNSITNLLLLAKTLIDYSLAKFQDILKPESPFNRLMKYSSPRMHLLLKQLSLFKPIETESEDVSPTTSRANKKGSLCGIIFVKKKSDVKLITLWLQELAKSVPEEYGFLKVNYVVGSTSTLTLEVSSKRQEEVLSKFRRHEYNVLIATSVLEEGLDIPRCNLVIRYDLPNTVREYVQSKGRARAEGAKYIIFCPDGNLRHEAEADLSNFQSIEQILKENFTGLGGPRDAEDESSIVVDPKFEESLAAKYSYKTQSGAVVSLISAISIINRYCLKLPSDSFTKLVPRIIPGETPEGQFTCELRLPINCPVREVLKSDPMPKKSLAKKVVAFKACVALHALKELDDNLLPIGKDNLKAILEELGFEPYGDESGQNAGINKKNQSKNEPRAGTTKRRQYYNKLTADVMKGSTPEEGTVCYLYVFAMKLTCKIPEEQNTRGRKLTDPSDTKRGFGILLRDRLPAICDFPVYTRSGEVMVSLEESRQRITITEEDVKRIIEFQRYTFHEVLHVDKYPMKFDIKESNTNFFLVPVVFNKVFDSGKWIDNSSLPDTVIDWAFMKRVDEFRSREDEVPTHEDRKNFVFKEEDFQDTVVKPWYRQNNVPFFYYVAEICSNLTPESSFPDMEYPSFASYYESKYGIQVMNRSQPLLDVDHTSARLNLLTPRYVNRKGMTLPMSTAKTKKEKRENAQLKQILIPELVVVHPFPASFWRKTVTLPCILYRLNSLFLADQLRRKIARDISLCPQSYKNISEKWSPLDFGWTLAEVLAQQKEEAEGRSHSRFSILDDHDDDDDETEVGRHSSSNFKSRSKHSSHHNKKNTKNRLTSVSSNDEAPDFLIDTFDPRKYTVPEDDDFDEDIQDEQIWKDIDMMSGMRGGVIDLGGLNQTLGGPIGTWDRKKSNAKSNKYPWFDSKPKIVELKNEDEVIKATAKIANGTSNQPRVGSPSNFDHLNQDEDDDGKPWGDNTEDETHGNFIDIGLSSGVSKIYAVGINIEGLCQDLTKSRVFEDDYDSEDSVVDDDEEEFGFSDMPVKKSEDKETNSLQRKHKSKVEPVNEIIVHGILGPSPVPSPVDPEEADICSILNDTDMDEESHETSDSVGPSSIVQKQLESLLEELNIEDLPDEHPQSPVSGTQDPTRQTQTNFGELLPKHRRQEMQDDNNQSQLDGLLLKFDALKSDSDALMGPSPCVILQALTMSNASDGINLERLETVGDSFLKYAVTLFLYCMCPSIHEGKLSYLRSRQISNYNLYRLGKRKGLGDYIIGCKFEPCDNWLPPGYIVPKGLEEALVDLGSPSLSYDLAELTKIQNLDSMTPEEVKREIFKRKEHFVLSSNPDNHEATFSDVDNVIRIPYNLLSQQSIPDKSIADCVEALIGAYLLYSGPKGALLFMKWLDLKVMPQTSEGIEKWPEDDPIWHHLPPVKSPLETILPDDPDYESKTSFQACQLQRLYSGSGLDRFERDILQYEFRDKSYLIQAFTHNSYFENQITDCYQRLEFLGDAILDFLVTRLLYEDPRKHSPGILTDLRSALVNNTFFASLAVEYEFHKYLKNLSHDLLRVKTEFVEKFNAKFYREHCSLYIAEGESENLDDVEVPKALGDVFESVAGAIFLDSGMSLDAVWTVYYRMMKPEIEHFSNNVPKSPIRELLEMEPQNAQFGKPEVIPGKKVRVCVEIFGEGKFFGVGRNKRIAKCTAAKRALRSLRPKKSEQVFFK